MISTLLAITACSGGKGRGQDGAGTMEAGAPREIAETPGPSPAPPRPERATPFRVATFNAGLAMGVLKHVDERVDPLVRALAEQPVDLLCVQEFWLEEHWQKLVAATSRALPNTFRLPPDHGMSGCEKDETAPLVACAESRCAGLTQHALLPCLLRSCAARLTGLSAGCFNCLSANPRQGPDELAQTCQQARTKSAAGARPPTRAGGAEALAAYSGSTGTGVLTSAEIVERDARTLPSAVDRRAVLYTKVAPPSLGELHVFCTHLTASMDGVPHPRARSWEDDQSAQLEALLAYIDEKTGGRGTTILLGDLNTGPGIAPAISARLPAHYGRVIARGFLNPYASQGDVKCTYCFDNPLDGKSGTRGLLVDHVLLRGFEGEAAGGQIMRQNVDIEVSGKKVRSGFSDHFGVRVTLSRRDS
jgi:endonuclease/exonuclease/phosphatase family metal-dependent hydrolase